MTSMPRRVGYVHEHTVVSFARSVADAIPVKFINDLFIETDERPDVTSLPEGNRESLLLRNWQYNGDLSNHTVILLDDVMASGSSLRAASRVLASVGACVRPHALLKLDDEEAEIERALIRHFEGRWGDLDVPDIQGSLRALVERLSRKCKT
jgi:phosphoribosylpyrophosphate synthetase